MDEPGAFLFCGFGVGIMREKEFKIIIDREKAEQDVKQHFSRHLELLIDLTNYGSNLIPRVFDSSDKKLVDIVLVCVLLKQVVSMVDAVEVLVSKGAVAAAAMPTRAAFEASLYIDWILNEDSVRKARYYYAWNLRKQRLWALRIINGTPEKALFSETMKEIDAFKIDDIENLEKQAEDSVGKVDEFLNKPDWIEINKEFEAKRNKKSGSDTEWYKLLGVSSIMEMAKRMRRLGEYYFWYARGSEVMHTASYRDHIQFEKGTVGLEPIRQMKEISLILRAITCVVIGSYSSILKHYRYGELSHFRRKYLQDWREPFLNIPSVKYIHQVSCLGA